MSGRPWRPWRLLKPSQVQKPNHVSGIAGGPLEAWRPLEASQEAPGGPPVAGLTKFFIKKLSIQENGN